MTNLDQITIKSRHGDVHGRQCGPKRGQLLLAIHGWSQRNGWHTWEPLMRPVAAAGFWMVAIDMPGWGESSRWAELDLRSSKDMTDVVLQLMDGLDVETAVLVGKSWGGGIALATALREPARVSALILTAPAFPAGEQLASVSQPVLLAWARDDPVLPFANSEQFVRRIPTCQFEEYETGGHSAAQRNASHFAAKAVAFLRGGSTL